MQKITLRQGVEIFLNVIFWAMAITILLLTTETGVIENVEEDDHGNIIRETIEMGPFILENFIGMLGIIPLFYLNTFYLIPKYYTNKKYLFFSGSLILGLILLIAFELIIVIFQRITIHSMMVRFFMFYNFFYIAIATVYGIIRHQFKIEQKQQLLEKEKVSAELRLMQSQINPHFMFNALNNLLAVSERSNNPETSSGITKLSDLLRFMIYDTQAERVPIVKEIEFIKNFISLQELRYSKEDPFVISFNIKTNQNNPQIAPTLLIPFVENAFKHGLHIQSPSFINIQLELKDHLLSFKVENSKHQLQKTEFEKKYSGVGLENVKRRLDLIYPNHHNLEIIEDEHTFCVQLKIELL
ncbi:sensor histidine kinase [Aquimarina sp. 2201CG5-10]|uniref:sensor histidine kinase n=1 Tax=Aquimarina callyspongiae TaxID=3098150 RepID=UPI002AB32B88|nr:histidine kinase [Aquimarina sp. 2201CG5-10]MDY8137349.1 histidine kinase [Aquimarina sp. 2201CG5-10]